MQTEQKTANQKAEEEFCRAEAAAEKSGLHGPFKWAFTCGVLRQKLEQSYENPQTIH